jgi:ubiquinone/menaquinone biosynthesis C-methylase UbiE
MLTQDKTEEIQINLAQLQREGENYRGSGWGKKKMNRVFSLLQKYVDFEEGRYEVLDLGCGGMTLGKELQDIPSFNVTGVDLVFQLLCTLSKKRTPHIPLVAGDIESLPFQDDTFDLIAHNQVLHHFLSRHIALSEVTRVLKAGGASF